MTPTHKVTRPSGERLPFREALSIAHLQAPDYAALLDGIVTSGMARGRDMVREDLRRREVRRHAKKAG